MQTLKLAKLVQIKIDTAISEAINEGSHVPGLHERVEPHAGARQEIIRRSQISHLIPFYVYGAPGSVKAGVIKA